MQVFARHQGAGYGIKEWWKYCAPQAVKQIRDPSLADMQVVRCIDDIRNAMLRETGAVPELPRWVGGFDSI